MVNAINDLSQSVRQSDEVQLATFYVQKFDRIKKTCLTDSELAMLKDHRNLQIQPKIDMESLDAFMKNLDTIQLEIDTFAVTAEMTEKYKPMDKLTAFAEHQQIAKNFYSQAKAETSAVKPKVSHPASGTQSGAASKRDPTNEFEDGD
jgi:hypothetical protein